MLENNNYRFYWSYNLYQIQGHMFNSLELQVGAIIRQARCWATLASQQMPFYYTFNMLKMLSYLGTTMYNHKLSCFEHLISKTT